MGDLRFIQLDSTSSIPTIGLGTWMVNGDELKKGLHEALEAGYRHIDTATAYHNEDDIGEVLEEWINSKKVTREELFIVTKLPPWAMNANEAKFMIAQSLKKLKIDYIDLYLIHCPFGFKQNDELYYSHDEDGNIILDNDTDHIAIWKELEKHVESGVLKSIGLSNFNMKQIEKVYESAEIKPQVLQIELHIYFQQQELSSYCKSKNIVITAYSPLGSKGNPALGDTPKRIDLPQLMSHPEVMKVAESLGKSVAQILLRFLIQKGFVVIPRSSTPNHLKANINIYDFELSEEIMSKIESLDLGDNGRLLVFSFFNGVRNHPEWPFPELI